MNESLKHLKVFLSLFPGKYITVQVLPDGEQTPQRLDTEHFHSKANIQDHYPDAKASKVSHRFLKSELPIKELKLAQKKGRAVWWMVNYGNGKLHLPDSPNCTSKDNVTHLTACFMDTDECPIETVNRYLQECDLSPHVIVRSSKGKYHLYFLLEGPVKVTEETQQKWKAIQRAFSHLGNPSDEKTGMDYSMHDTSKVLRLPGFYHMKGKPQLVKIIQRNTHAKYTLKELYVKSGAENFLKTEGLKVATYDLPDKKISKGARHEAITEYLSSRSNHYESKQDLLNGTYGFIVNNIEQPQIFLPSGSRNNEITRLVDYYADLRNKEKVEQQKQLSKELLSQVDKKDPFALDDQFYFDCPGLVGQMTKHICDRSRYPIPAFTFATVAAALGTLKAKTTTTVHGHAPANYFMCLSNTGTGKNYAQETINATFTHLNMRKSVDKRIRSSGGIVHLLQKSDGAAFLMLDEAEGFLTRLYGKDTQPYIKECRDVLLDLYTATNTPEWSSGYLTKEEPVILKYPRLNMICYGVIHTLSEAFSMKTVADGLLQRFIVVTHYGDRIRNEQFKPGTALNSNLIVELQDLVRGNRLKEESLGLKIADIQKKIKDTEHPAKLKQLKHDLGKLSVGLCHRNKIDFEPDALKQWNSFSDKMDKAYNTERKKGTHLEGLYTRAAEQVGRLGCAIANGSTLNKLSMEWCIEFIHSRVRATKAYCEESLDRGEGNKDMADLVQFIRSQLVSGKASAVTMRDLYQSFRIRSPRALKETIDAAVEAHMIERIEGYRDPSATHGRKGTAFTIAD